MIEKKNVSKIKKQIDRLTILRREGYGSEQLGGPGGKDRGGDGAAGSPATNLGADWL